MKKVLLPLWLLAAVLSIAAAPSDDALERALALAAERRYAEARAVLDPLLGPRADHPRARLLDGILHAREGRVSQAIEVLDRLRRDHPERSEPWDNLAILHAAEGRFDEAREMLLAALERRPAAAGHANLGDLYGELARRAGRRDAQGSGRSPSDGGDGAALSLPPEASIRSASGSAARGAAPDVGPRLPGREDSPAARTTCLRAGGFEDRRVLAGVEEWMESRGVEVLDLHRVRGRGIGTHQVYLPPFESRGEAVAKAGEIRARGVQDVSVIESGPLKNGLSLGVFSVTDNLRRRVAALERLGYRVRHRENREAIRRYYYEARTEADPERLRAEWTERFPVRSFKLIDCR